MASSQWTDSSSSPGAEATARLAAHIAGATIDALAPDTLHAFRRSLLDFLTCAIAGSAMPVSRALLGYFADTDPSHAATVIGHGTRLSAPNAAFVNGANTHALDFDDGHTNASAHPAGAVFPAVLALAEQLGTRVDAADIALAAVVGYDAMLRIAEGKSRRAEQPTLADLIREADANDHHHGSETPTADQEDDGAGCAPELQAVAGAGPVPTE